MIIIYPVVLSKSINPDIIPGICKSIEKYILIYEQDKLFESVNDELKKSGKETLAGKATRIVSKKSQGLLSLESYTLEAFGDILDVRDAVVGDEAAEKTGKTGGRPTKSKTTDLQRQEKQYKKETPKDREKEREKERERTNDEPLQRTVGVIEPKLSSDSITAEPTYILLDIQGKGTKVLGVKAVPFIINDDRHLVHLLLTDKGMDSLSKNIHAKARQVLGFMYKVANKFWTHTVGPLLSWTGFVSTELYKSTLSGDWKKDIVLGLTKFKKNIFFVLNSMDLKTDFLSKPSAINKLYSLGWTSFIINDDINKRTLFCMKEFKGLCSIANHDYLYSSVGRITHTAYRDIQDVKKSSGPLWSLKGRINKMLLKDDLASEKLKKYYPEKYISEQVLEESFFEDVFNNFRNSLKSKQSIISFASNLKKYSENNEFDKVYKLLKSVKVKPMPFDKIKSYAKNKLKNFESNYNLCTKTLINSLPKGMPKALLDASAVSISIVSKDKSECIKNLQKVVERTMKSVRQGNTEWDKELIVAFCFATILVTLSATVATLFIISLPEIITIGFNSVAIILGIIAAISFMWLISKLFGSEEKDFRWVNVGEPVGTTELSKPENYEY